MAWKTNTLNVTKFAYIRSKYPSTHYQVSSSEWYTIGDVAISGDGQCDMLFALPAWPSNLKHNKLIGVQFLAQLDGKSQFSLIIAEVNNGGFDANTVTWYTAPAAISGTVAGYSFNSTGTGDYYIPKEITGTTGQAESAHDALSKESLRFSSNTNTCKMKTVLSNGTALKAVITYDDSIKVESNVQRMEGPISGSVSPADATTFSWDYVKAVDNVYCADETWTQKSATFYWKKSTESSYHSVELSGNTKRVTIQANTFQTGSTIQWYVRGTDEDDTTTQTSVYSFSTYATTITPDTYPTGNSVDNRTAKSFTWHFAIPGGNFGQSSATLYWRVQNAETWKTIAASGSTQSLSVPAYTFPAGSTIEWYLRGVDATGTASTSATATFSTLAYTLTVTTKPASSNAATNKANTFAWTLSNTQGAATQKSAILYWRVQGAATYTAITNSTATKSISVPANTFPTASTIEWYLSVTAADNTAKSTNAATFTTASPQITPTQYPSGSDVYSGADIVIKWKLASAAGDYDQKSAVFYWRKSTSDPYTSMSVSGNTQQVTIPENTFPTNTTIYWYLTGVDIGNHSSSTSVQSFKTSTTQITPQSSPTAGYTNPRNAITFSWYFAASGGSIPQGSASLYWRVQGSSNWTQVAASGSTTSVTIPANTFPVASVVEWYIAGSDSSGTSSQSSVYSFSTTASTVYAVVKSPINSGVDGAMPITFQWTLTTADGYAPSRVILEWKLPTEDGQHWHTIVDTTDAIHQYTVDGGTFQPGEINWRVRAYNVDNVGGPESAASFICIIAPTITALTASNVPFSVISWQAEDQQGYQLEIDGAVYGPYPGTEKQFEIPDYFRDGVHEIKLRIIGSVDLWSEWAETTVSIQNEPGDPITVTAEADVNVTLEWQASDTEADFYLYRDGKLIGRTGNTKFVDRFSLGTHEYTVINRLADGDYSLSETISKTTAVEYLYFSTADGLTEVSINYRLKGTSDPEHKYSRETHMTQLAGHDYRKLTKSRFRDHEIVCSCVILRTEEGKDEAFRSLIGEEIVAKLRDGTCCAAVIESFIRAPRKENFTAYEFSLHEIEWEDYDDTQ